MSHVQLSLQELTESKPHRILVDGTPVCLIRKGEEVFAVADTCTHSDASLAEGECTGFTIECWLHGAEFDIRTGEALTPPAVEGLETFEVSVDSDSVIVSRKS